MSPFGRTCSRGDWVYQPIDCRQKLRLRTSPKTRSLTPGGSTDSEARRLGCQAIDSQTVAVVTLAAGVGSRWTQGAGVCKALHPFARFAGHHRSFLEVHLAKTRRTMAVHQVAIPHVTTTSWMTDRPIQSAVEKLKSRHPGPLHVSTGKSVGLRMVPTIADLQFLWEETAQQALDAQQEKVRSSVRAATLQWVRSVGESADYVDNIPSQCVHPVGHWFEVPNLLRNGTLAAMIEKQPTLQTILLHNVDTLGASLDPELLGHHLQSGVALSYEVVGRRLSDRGGGLASVLGRPRLVEGLAMPTEKVEFDLSYYNSMTTWIDIDQLLKAFGLVRSDLSDPPKVDAAVRVLAARLPTYVTIKDVKKRWGNWTGRCLSRLAIRENYGGDMTTLSDVRCQFLITSMKRGQQLKEPRQLDGWNRDGTASWVNSLCQW